MTEHWDSVTSLIAGLQAVLSKHRSSFTDEEVELLNTCIEQFKKSKEIGNSLISPDFIVDTIRLFLKIFSLFDDFDKFQF